MRPIKRTSMHVLTGDVVAWLAAALLTVGAILGAGCAAYALSGGSDRQIPVSEAPSEYVRDCLSAAGYTDVAPSGAVETCERLVIFGDPDPAPVVARYVSSPEPEDYYEVRENTRDDGEAVTDPVAKCLMEHGARGRQGDHMEALYAHPDVIRICKRLTVPTDVVRSV